MKRIFILSFCYFAPSFALADSLSLDDYLSQVKTKHEGVRGSMLNAEAAEQRAPESSLPLAWTLNANVEQRNDFQRPLGVFFQSTSTLYSLGVSKLTSFGLNSKLTFTVQPYSYVNIPASFASLFSYTTYYNATTTVELTQSLWKNGFGRTTRAQRDLDQATALMTHYQTSYDVVRSLSKAEGAYWNAAASQEIVRIQKVNLERAQKLVQWSKGRTSLDLADKADLLQAESAYRLREMELAQSMSDLRTHSRMLNALRSIDSDSLDESLASVYIANVESITPLPRAKFRPDVLAAVEETRMAEARAALGAERNNPTFEAYVQYSLTGRDPNLNTALSFMPNATYTLGVFGVRFATPLDFGLLADDKAAYLKEQRAAELNRSRKQFDQENDWTELTRKLTEAKDKLRLARAVEEAQSQKYHYEQERLKHARTTLFQVLQFEQDYATAQLGRIQREAEVRSILTEMKTFGEST